MAESLGKAVLELAADTRKLDRDLDRAETQSDSKARKIGAGMRMGINKELDPTFADIRVKLERLNSVSSNPKVRLATDQATTQLNALQARLTKLGVDKTTHHVKVETDLEKNLSRIGPAIFKLVKPAAIIAFGGLAAQAASAGTAAVVALTSALAPATGVLAAYPGLLASVGQGMAVAKIGTLGLAEAMKPLGEALAKPTPAVKALGKELSEALLPNIRHVRNIAQRGLLPGVAEGARSAMSVFRYLDPIIKGTAEALGGLAKKAGELVGSAGFGKDLQTVGLRNVGILKILGTGAISAANALRHIVVVAGPLTTWLAKLGAGWAKSAESAARAGRESGTMARFFESARAAAERLVSIGSSLANIFLNIGRVAGPLGRDMLAALDGAAKRFAEWTDSAKGQSSIAKFFENMRPAIWEVGRLIRDVTKAFVGLGNQPGLGNMIKQVRTELLPVLTRVMSSTTAAFGPAMINAIIAFAKAFEPLAGSSGPLVIFVKTLTMLAEAAAFIIRTVPGAGVALTTLVGAMAVSKALGFASSITGVGKAVSLARGHFAAATPTVAANTTALRANRTASLMGAVAAARQAIATAAVTAAWRVQAVAAKAAAAAQWLLNIAMKANPFLRIVTVLFALGAALIYAYKKSETFRNIVNGAFNAVKSVVIPVVAALGAAMKWLAGAIGVAWTVIRTVISTHLAIIVGLVKFAWNAVRTITLAVWNAIRNNLGAILRTIVSVIVSPINFLRSFISGAWNSIRSATSSAWNAIRETISTVINSIVNFVRGLPGKIVSALSSLAGKMRSTASDAFGDFLDGVKRISGSVIDYVRGIPGKIVSALGNVGNLLFGAGKSIIEGLARGILSALSGLYNKVKSIAGKIKSLKGPIQKDKVLLRDEGQAIIQGLGRGMFKEFGRLQREISGYAPTIQATVSATSQVRRAPASSMQTAGPTVNVEKMEVRDPFDIDLVSAQLAWRLAR